MSFKKPGWRSSCAGGLASLTGVRGRVRTGALRVRLALVDRRDRLDLRVGVTRLVGEALCASGAGCRVGALEVALSLTGVATTT